MTDVQLFCHAIQRDRITTLRCLDCKSLVKCAACKTGYQKTYWSRKERNHAQQQNTALVCKACREKGCTPRDTHLYTCTSCRKEMGLARFDKHSIHNFKYHKYRSLTCNSCVAAKTARVKTLQAQLRQSKQVCKCFCRLHKERCPLSLLCYYGKRGWPGSDGYISEEDRNFLDGLRPMPTWWLRAWGR